MKKEAVSVFWFRRDLRLDDNRGLFEALQSPFPVLPVFIFDSEITDELDKDDARITFIYETLNKLSLQLGERSSCIYCTKGNPIAVWRTLLDKYNVKAVYANEDYEPYAIKRDQEVAQLLHQNDIQFNLFKDQVIFAKGEVLKGDKTPYTVFTPYKNKWLELFSADSLKDYTPDTNSNFLKFDMPFPEISELGFTRSSIKVLNYKLDQLDNYETARNFPAKNQTSYLSPHLRFGSVSVRKVILETMENKTFVSELIWREFFMQILFHFPDVVSNNFKRKYDGVQWRNHPQEFEKWKNGQTGYPIVDAGMRELNTTGYMHNRVRMIVAGFLCKHLLIDWKWGEAYFAKKLLDFELSSNNGNWQWSAGTGCDSAPYFRIFNPTEQVKKFDAERIYLKKWIPELDTLDYPSPMVDHKSARARALETYKKGLVVN